jgi:phosphate transport system substrate-binding protein
MIRTDSCSLLWPWLLLELLLTFSSLTTPVNAQDATGTTKIWLPGATGSGPFDVANAWATAFIAKHPEAQVTLTSVGSGAAQTALWGDIDCDKKPVQAICDQANSSVTETLWGLGDAPIKSSAYEDQPALELQQFPACAGAVVVVYSKEVTPGTDANPNPALRMTFQVLSGILNTSIAYWDDPAIQQLNPTLVLPHERISKVVRLDSSGQSSILTDALGFQVPAWPEEAVGSAPEWPLGTLANPLELLRAPSCEEASVEIVNGSQTNGRPYSFAADGKNGISLGLMRVPYSIGYLEMGFFGRLTDFLQQVQLGSESEFIAASDETVRATMAGLAEELEPDTLELNLARTETPPGGYPVAGYAYWYLKKTPEAYSSCYQAWLLCQFVTWSYSDPQAAQLALANGWVVPPPAVINQTLERLQDVMCYDTEVHAVVSALSYIPPPYRTTPEGPPVLIITIISVAVGLIGLIGAGWMLDRYAKKRGQDSLWKIAPAELHFGDPPQVIGRGKFGEVLLAEYRGTQVAVKRVIPVIPAQSDHNNRNGSIVGAGALTKSSDHSMGKSSNHKTLSVSEGQSGSLWRQSGAIYNLATKTLVFKRIGLVSSRDGSSGEAYKQSLRKRKQDLVAEMRYLSNLRHPCKLALCLVGCLDIHGGLVRDDDDIDRWAELIISHETAASCPRRHYSHGSCHGR